jgi:adenylosuccinate synthase
VIYLHEGTRDQKNILFEGAQGTFLDIDHGTYPFVTSSNTTAGGACTGSGIPPHRMDRVVGVMKAYTTRVGEGPLPTESDEIGDMLHSMGREFGATTGRARRCGWFDAVATRHATMVNGLDDLAVTNVDGLDTVDVIRVCVGYQIGSRKYDYVPNDIDMLAQCKPVYVDFPGWKQPTHEVKTWKEMPGRAKTYLNALAEFTGAKLTIVSVGPAREQTIFL